MRHLRIPIVLFALTVASVTVAQVQPRNLAVVNGEAITDEDVARIADARIRQLASTRDESQSDASFERARLALRWDALNLLVEKKLIRAEATRQMISENALIEKEIDDKIPEVPIEVVDAFIAANSVRMPLVKRLSHPEAVSQVRGYLSVQAEHLLHAEFIDRLSKQYGVKTFLDPLRTDVVTEGYPVRGETAAPVTIVEFSDFECADCATMAETLRTLQETNNGKVKIVYRQFPLAHLNAHAQKAAEASLCAADQQHFWEFHDSLFKNQSNLAESDLKNRAASLNLDTTAFNECLDSGKHVPGIDKEIDEAYSAGVMTAPTIFINGRMLFGNRSSREIQQILDEELQHSSR